VPAALTKFPDQTMIRDQLTIVIVAFAISFVAITEVMLSLMYH
jgi:hypothetical protein